MITKKREVAMDPSRPFDYIGKKIRYSSKHGYFVPERYDETEGLFTGQGYEGHPSTNLDGIGWRPDHLFYVLETVFELNERMEYL